ncbi:MAG: S8 family peptidase [Leptolyngbya sp. IPPAS B-1204]|nr:MAG: hypothetical protein EDM05_20940 [Leptolyngbya sp. IPPAS B-1204]
MLDASLTPFSSGDITASSSGLLNLNQRDILASQLSSSLAPLSLGLESGQPLTRRSQTLNWLDSGFAPMQCTSDLGWEQHRGKSAPLACDRLTGLTLDQPWVATSKATNKAARFQNSEFLHTDRLQAEPTTKRVVKRTTPTRQAAIRLNAEAFDRIRGYGLVNAAAAVARSIDAPRFASLADFGGNNWNLDAVQAPDVWARGFTGQGVTVAVIDSGVDITHSDLRDNIWINSDEIAGDGIDNDVNGYIDDINGWNFGIGQNNANVSPGTNNSGQEHGTHVAGTIAARNNGSGNTGVAPDAKIMALRLGDVADGWFVNGGSLPEAIRYAVDNGARVINLSLGSADSPQLQSALAYAASRNVVTVSASGNEGLLSPGAPARYATQYGLSVGAVNRERSVARFSNRAGGSPRLRHVVAPGVQIYSTLPGNSYGFLSGTSMATPHVAGTVALMLSANPTLTHSQVRQILTDTAVG